MRLSNLVLLTVLAVFGLTLGACAKGDMSGGGANTIGGVTAGETGDGGSDGDGESNICLLHNCESDLECGGCSEGRNTCYGPEKRCVACDPDSGEGCDDGEECTEFGNCVPEGQTCETDDEGNPTISCSDDPDCGACDPLHQVCAAGNCVACRGDNDEACLGTQTCVDNECINKCPESCDTDSDCGQCGEEGHEARACHRHQCAQCSDTSPCPNGQQCTDRGVCVDICGIPGQVAGTCETNSDCAGCEGDLTNCNAPINGGHGECGPTASGCSDLGNGVVVLPDPFDQVTNTCSNDTDCNGVGITYNVGKLLRELTGVESIDDANIEYPMKRCADITVGVGGSSISCGVCTPCKVDNDCQDIDIDDVAGDAFGPLGVIATALLLDSLFGDSEHQIYMFCQPVAGDYGVCAPCPTFINDCAGGGSGGQGSGNCDHDVCTAGGPLDPSCGSCAESVCATDGYCCTTSWDSVCVDETDDFCAVGCSGGGGGGCHDPCEEGASLHAGCGSCAEDVCDEDPFCCQSQWDDICVDWATDLCGCTGGCAHSECSTGGPLTEGCSSCVDTVCAADDFCCIYDWDSTCVGEAEDLCPTVC